MLQSAEDAQLVHQFAAFRGARGGGAPGNDGEWCWEPCRRLRGRPGAEDEVLDASPFDHRAV
ncbi:hypothetical protein GCM10009849_12560 [Sinomonas flava]|uniref:Uncharacterized protein n=1 Tax=Sinomonas flava TaxID=496857 RepID=A0ABN3BPB0_9MICC